MLIINKIPYYNCSDCIWFKDCKIWREIIGINNNDGFDETLSKFKQYFSKIKNILEILIETNRITILCGKFIDLSKKKDLN